MTRAPRGHGLRRAIGGGRIAPGEFTTPQEAPFPLPPAAVILIRGRSAVNQLTLTPSARVAVSPLPLNGFPR